MNENNNKTSTICLVLGIISVIIPNPITSMWAMALSYNESIRISKYAFAGRVLGTIGVILFAVISTVLTVSISAPPEPKPVQIIL